jgi:hypothetical protein
MARGGGRGRLLGIGGTLVDGRALTWYGPRIPAAIAALGKLLGK